MAVKKLILSTLVLGLAIQPAWVEASEDKDKNKEEWTVGAAFSHKTLPYKSYDSINGVWSMVGYNHGKFYVRGTEAGFTVWEKGPHQIATSLTYNNFEFNPKDTSNRRLQELDKRKSTVMLDVNYLYTSPGGVFKAKTSWDILGRSDGFLADVSYRYPLALKKDFKVYSGIGVEWANKNYHDYYYGVSNQEALRSGLSPYKAGSGFTPYLVLEARYDVSKSLSFFAAGRLNFLSEEIKDSPMTSSSATTSVGIGAEYKF